jgi:hypothetical protein
MMFSTDKRNPINGTWIDPEERAYPHNTVARRGQAILVKNPHCALDLPYGKLILFRAACPDTFFSIPAKFHYAGENSLVWTGLVRCYIRTANDDKTLELVPEACTVETDENGMIEVTW